MIYWKNKKIILICIYDQIQKVIPFMYTIKILIIIIWYPLLVLENMRKFICGAYPLTKGKKRQKNGVARINFSFLLNSSSKHLIRLDWSWVTKLKPKISFQEKKIRSKFHVTSWSCLMNHRSSLHVSSLLQLLIVIFYKNSKDFSTKKK